MVLLLQRVVVVFGDIVVIPHKAFTTPIETKRSWVFVNTTTVSSLCCCVCNNKGRTSRLFQRHIFRVLCPSTPSLPLFFSFPFFKVFCCCFYVFLVKEEEAKKRRNKKKEAKKKDLQLLLLLFFLLSLFFSTKDDKRRPQKKDF